MMNIGFLGVGNMGGAILKGYAGKRGEEGPASRDGNDVFAFNRSRDKLQKICGDYNAGLCESIDELVKVSDFLIIGIKPYQFDEVMPEVKAALDRYDSPGKDKVVVSMAAGVPIVKLEERLGAGRQIIRIMPNTPAQVAAAMTALCGNNAATGAATETVLSIFSSIGRAEEVAESLMDCVIGVSGSSPAYAYMFIEALMDAAVKNGMSKEQAKIFAAQSVKGASEMVLASGDDPGKLRDNVCSPGGATIEAVNSLREDKLSEVVARAFDAAVTRSKQMNEE